jgi:predicted O-methyltransferase YrrM
VNMNVYINPFLRAVNSFLNLLEPLMNKLRQVRSVANRQPAESHAQVVQVRPQLLEVNKWATSEYLPKLVRIVGHSPYPLDELMLMAAAFEYHRPDIVIDIGTHVGKSARIWFELSKRLKASAAIHTVDLCDKNHPEYPGWRLGIYIRGLPVQQHVGDGYDCALRIIRASSPTNCFLIFLDGDHSYETVQRELQLAQLIKKGCILVHDTFYQPGSTYNHGPYMAIQEALPNLSVRQTIHLQTGLPGMSYLALG